MNKRNLALLISKHPLLRKLTEDKTIPNSVVARLIVEELMEAQSGLLKSALAGIRRDFSQNKQDKYMDPKTKQAVYPYAKLDQLNEEEQKKYKDAVNKKIKAFLAKQNPDTKAQGEKIEKQVDVAIDKEINTPQAPQTNPQELVDIITSTIVDMGKQQDYISNYQKNPTAAMDFILTKTPEEQVDVLKTAPPETQQKIVKAVADELEKDQQENPFNPQEIYEKGFDDAEKEVLKKFKTFIAKEDPIEEVVNIANVLGLKKETIGNFMKTLDNVKEVPVFKSVFAKIQKDNKLLKGVNWFLEQDEEKSEPVSPFKELNLKPEEERVFVSFMNKLKESKIIKEANLTQLGKMIGAGKGLTKIIKSFEGAERKILINLLQRDDVQAFIQKSLSSTAEPDKEEKSSTDPEKFDVDPELLNSLIEVSETFIDEFYEKAFLKDQGILLKSVLTVLATIVEKEELEKAAKRTPQPTEQSEETEETVTEQEEQPRQDPVKLRNIQVDLKSFIKLVKRSKDVLKAFDEFRAKGKVVGSSYKEKFMNILKQLQKNIKALVRDISTLNLISEKKDVSETANKWAAIEKGYNEASRSLSNIITAGAEDIESFDMEKNVNDAYTSLMSISGFFPSVNPFGTKTTNFNEYNDLYTAAVKNIKSTIRDVLELAKGKGGSNTVSNTIESLKEFSGQIQSIFDIPSQFEDVQTKPNEKAAENEETTTEPEIKTVEPSSNQGILKLPKPERLTPEQEKVLKDIKYSEEDTEIVKRTAEVFVGVDSIPTEPEQIKKAAEEVKELKKDMEEMTQMSNQFGFEPEEMRAMVGLKRFLDREKQSLAENLEIPAKISDKIEEYGKQLEQADEGSYEVFKAALEKAGNLPESEKNEFYKFLGIPTKKDVDRERVLRNKITEKAKKLDSKDPMKYFENYYDGDTALTPSANDQENKKQKIIKLNQNFSKLFSLYSDKLFDDDKTSVTESVMTNVKRLLTEEEYRALDKAFDFLLDKISTREYQEMLGFIGQVGSKVLEPTVTAPDILQKEHNAFDIFIEVLKGISYGILGSPSGQFNDETTKVFRGDESLHEQLANKLKPLIKEMLTKGK